MRELWGCHSDTVSPRSSRVTLVQAYSNSLSLHFSMAQLPNISMESSTIFWLANPQELTQNHSHGQSQHTCKKGACRLEHNTYRQIGLTREDLAQSCTSSGTKFAPAFACACLSVKLGILLWDFSCSISRSRKVAPKVLKHNIHGNIISGYHHAIAVGNANFRETATSINRVLPFVCHVVPRSFVWSFASELWQLLLYGVFSFSCNEKGQTWTDGGPAC